VALGALRGFYLNLIQIEFGEGRSDTLRTLSHGKQAPRYVYLEGSEDRNLKRGEYAASQKKEKATSISECGLYLCRQRPQFTLSLPKGSHTLGACSTIGPAAQVKAVCGEVIF
jgi:hypothetical protein